MTRLLKQYIHKCQECLQDEIFVVPKKVKFWEFDSRFPEMNVFCGS